MADAKPDDETRKFSSLKLDPEKLATLKAEDLHIMKPPRYLCPKHGVIEFAIVSVIKGKEGAWCQICHIEWFDEHISKVDRLTEKK